MGKVIDISKHQDNKQLELELKIIEANGFLEIEEYKKLVEKLIEDVSSLSLFKALMDDMLAEQIRYFMIYELLDNYIKLIFINEKPVFLKEEDFLQMRKEMFENLIKKYVENN